MFRVESSKMEDNVVKLCAEGLFQKLPFLLEEREEANLKAFFNNPRDYAAAEVNGEKCQDEKLAIHPISVEERKRILETVLKKVQNEKVSLEWWRQLPPNGRVKIILFLSESSDGSQLWSNIGCSSLVVQICDEISKRLDRDDDSKLGTQNSLGLWVRKNSEECLTPNETDFYHILQSLRVKFNKTNWKYFPASVHGFGWIVPLISKPMLSSHIDMIIPPSLMFSDDHFDDFKVVGLKLLSFIVHNSDKADLVRNNWANVMYDATQRHLTDKDPAVIELMMSILMKLLEITETNPSVNSSQFTKYDHLLKQVLFQMEFSSDLDQKRTFLPILSTYLNTLGLASLHWSDKICDVLRDYTVCSDSIIWKNVLDVTATLIKNTWPKPDSESISEIILRVVMNVSSFHAVDLRDEEKKAIIEQATNCLRLLQKCDDFITVKIQLTEIMELGHSEHLHPNFLMSLKQILTQQQT